MKLNFCIKVPAEDEDTVAALASNGEPDRLLTYMLCHKGGYTVDMDPE